MMRILFPLQDCTLLPHSFHEMAYSNGQVAGGHSGPIQMVCIHLSDREVRVLCVLLVWFTYVLLSKFFHVPKTVDYFCYSFLIIPGYTFALSLAGPIAMYVGLMPLFAILVISISVTAVQVNMSSSCLANFKFWGLGPWQNKYPKVLPKTMRSWDFLPEFMRSLAPYDRYHWNKIV